VRRAARRRADGDCAVCGAGRTTKMVKTRQNAEVKRTRLANVLTSCSTSKQTRSPDVRGVYFQPSVRPHDQLKASPTKENRRRNRAVRRRWNTSAAAHLDGRSSPDQAPRHRTRRHTKRTPPRPVTCGPSRSVAVAVARLGPTEQTKEILSMAGRLIRGWAKQSEDGK